MASGQWLFSTMVPLWYRHIGHLWDVVGWAGRPIPPDFSALVCGGRRWELWGNGGPRTENPMWLEQLKAGAVPFQYPDWLVVERVRTIAPHGAGIPVAVPQPAKFVVHKPFVTQQRVPR